MSDPPPLGRARVAYRKVKDAAGVSELPALEAHVDALEEAVAEELGLTAALADVVGRVEASLLPLLEARAHVSVDAAGTPLTTIGTVTQDTPTVT